MDMTPKREILAEMLKKMTIEEKLKYLNQSQKQYLNACMEQKLSCGSTAQKGSGNTKDVPSAQKHHQKNPLF